MNIDNWKCPTCVYAVEYDGTFADSEGNEIGIKCGHPDEDISIINNDVLSEGKSITECCEYKEGPPASPKPKQEEALLAKTEELRQEGNV